MEELFAYCIRGNISKNTLSDLLQKMNTEELTDTPLSYYDPLGFNYFGKLVINSVKDEDGYLLAAKYFSMYPDQPEWLELLRKKAKI